MNEHFFISYSYADGLDFAEKLVNELEGGHPFIKTWYEKRDSVSGLNDWDNQLAKAIRTSKALLFIMSKDSTAENSNCKDEWMWALKYKKPVICLQIDADAEDQFLLNSRQKIDDFIVDFEVGMGKLRKSIQHLDSPEGLLAELKKRLADAQRDLRRAGEAEKARVQADVEDLQKQVQVQERIVANPKAAEEQTQKNIESGLERERQPESPIIKKSGTKFINPAPMIAPDYFQDRVSETKEVIKFLKNDAQRLMTVVGRGGVGKTAMVCRLLKAIENGTLPDNLGKFKLGGIVYLSETGSHRITFDNIFHDLCKLLPAEVADDLAKQYKDPQSSTERKMKALLAHFQGERVLLLLDNFEPLINPENATIRDSEVNAALHALLDGENHAVNALITTRIAPRALNLYQPGRQRSPLGFDEGLIHPYAENILREMDTDGTLGLRARPEQDADLQRARVKTRGYPKALIAFFAILASDRYTTLEELLEMPLPENVIEALVGEAFSRLSATAQKVMQALAIYNRPVSPAAVDYLLQPHLNEIDSAPILKRLTNMRFVRYEAGRFYLHPVDSEFALGLISEEDLTAKTAENAKEKTERNLLKSSRSWRSSRFSSFTRHDLRQRAANYYRHARKPRAEWKSLADLSAQLAEFDLRCSAGDYDTAADVLTDIDFDYLLLWGHYHLMIKLHEKLQEKIKALRLARISAGNLGLALYSTGKVQEAITKYERSLEMAKKAQSTQAEGVWLGNLGLAYAALGETKKAIEYHEQALTIDREIGDKRGEGSDLGNLGNRYADLGETKKAIEYYEQALTIDREIGDRRGEGADLGNLAELYSRLGKYEKSLDYYEEALENAREIGNKYGESKRLNGLAGILIEKGDFEGAIKHAKESFAIGEEMSSPEVCVESSDTLAQAFLFSENLAEALQVTQKARQYDQPAFTFHVFTLHGILLLRMKDLTGLRESPPNGKGSAEDLSGLAVAAFERAIAQADEILAKTPGYYEALDAKGLALCGLVLCKNLIGLNEGIANPEAVEQNQHGLTEAQGDLSGLVNQAIETFKKARQIAPHQGVAKRVLRLFDELAKCDEGGRLKGLREHVAGEK